MRTCVRVSSELVQPINGSILRGLGVSNSKNPFVGAGAALLHRALCGLEDTGGHAAWDQKRLE